MSKCSPARSCDEGAQDREDLGVTSRAAGIAQSDQRASNTAQISRTSGAGSSGGRVLERGQRLVAREAGQRAGGRLARRHVGRRHGVEQRRRRVGPLQAGQRGDQQRRRPRRPRSRAPRAARDPPLDVRRQRRDDLLGLPGEPQQVGEHAGRGRARRGGQEAAAPPRARSRPRRAAASRSAASTSGIRNAASADSATSRVAGSGDAAAASISGKRARRACATPEADERRALDVAVGIGRPRVCQRGGGGVAVEVRQRLDRRDADLAGRIGEQADDRLGGRLERQLAQRLAGVVADPGVGIGEPLQQIGGHAQVAAALAQAAHRRRARPLRRRPWPRRAAPRRRAGRP